MAYVVTVSLSIYWYFLLTSEHGRPMDVYIVYLLLLLSD